MDKCNQITIGIPTRNRHVYFSDLAQNISNFKCIKNVIVVDSSTNFFDRYNNRTLSKKLGFQYFFSSRKGVSYSRNIIIQKTKTKYLALLDDDCVPDKYWSREIIKSSRLISKKTVFIQGISVPMDKNNIWSKAKHLDDKRKTLLIKQGKKLLEFCLDTKNLLLNREAVIKNNIIFDHRYSVLGCGYEDIDLGTQILEKGLGGKLNSKLIVDHHDPNSFLGIVNTRLRWGALYPLYKQKWTVLLDKYALPLNNQITTSNSLANLFRYLFLYIFSIKKIYLNKFSKTLVFLTISFSLKIGEILSKPIIEFMNLKNSSIPTFSSKEP